MKNTSIVPEVWNNSLLVESGYGGHLVHIAHLCTRHQRLSARLPYISTAHPMNNRVTVHWYIPRVVYCLPWTQTHLSQPGDTQGYTVHWRLGTSRQNTLHCYFPCGLKKIQPDLSLEISTYNQITTRCNKVQDCFDLHMNTHSSVHMITTTTKTTAVMMMARCLMFNRYAHSLLRPFGFRLVFLYFLRRARRVWSTVATSTDTSVICRRRGGGCGGCGGCCMEKIALVQYKCHRRSSKFHLPF